MEKRYDKIKRQIINWKEILATPGTEKELMSSTHRMEKLEEEASSEGAGLQAQVSAVCRLTGPWEDRAAVCGQL